MPSPIISAAIYGIKGTSLSGDERKFFADTQPYGFILFARNCKSPQQIRALVFELEEVTGRTHLPILIDQEGGRVARLKPPHWPEFPPASVFAKIYADAPEKAVRAAYLNARLIAHELASLGITVDCAPVADVPSPGAHDVIGDRAFGVNPAQVSALARAQAQGLMDGGIVPVLKHIPGHGRAGADSHEELPVVSEDAATLRENDFVPFKALADLPMAMTAHVLYPALDAKHMATLSPVIIDLIRKEIGFDGLLMSDDLSMKALGGDFTERARNVLAAGCDTVLHCNGDIEEMRAVAKGVGPLEGKAMERAKKAMENRQPLPQADYAAMRHELSALLNQSTIQRA